MDPIVLAGGDALLVTDLQQDFLPGGSLAVRGGEEVVPIMNRYIRHFVRRGLPVFATRDWHPPNHCSFRAQGGPWPVHCVAGRAGAAFPAALALPPGACVVSKATDADREAYSSFGGGELAQRLRAAGISRLFVGGLTTDYCVLNTVIDALGLGFDVMLLTDAIRAVDVQPGDGAAALARMSARGAHPMRLEDLADERAATQP